MQSKYVFVIIVSFVFFIMGCNEDGKGSQMEQTLETPQVATGMKIETKIGNDTIEVYWQINEKVKSYILEFGDKESGLNKHVALDAQTTSYKISNLPEGTVFLFRLVSISRDGRVTNSKVIEAKTGMTNKFLQIDNGSKV